MQSVLALAKGNKCKDGKICVLFDSGSHTAFITCCIAVGLLLQPVREESLSIKTVGCSKVDEKMREVVRVDLELTERKEDRIITVCVVDKMSKEANEHLELIKHDHEHLNDIWFSDVSRSFTLYGLRV